MEERSLRVVATDKTFFNKLTNTLTKFLIPTQIGFNSLKISMKRNVLIKTYETAEPRALRFCVFCGAGAVRLPFWYASLYINLV